MDGRWLAGWMVLVLWIGPPSRCAGAVAEIVQCEGQTFTYLCFRPSSPGPRPAILLLHGAGDDPKNMVAAWSSLAAQEGIVLIAPALPRTLAFEAMAPRVFRGVLKDVERTSRLDPRRIYVFGNSMGGYLAYDALAFLSDRIAAVGVHAMGIAPEYDGILDHADRKAPVAIYIGDRDPLVPLAGIRRTQNLLERRGFPTRLTVLEHHDHDYYAVSDPVNADAWAFFRLHPRP